VIMKTVSINSDAPHPHCQPRPTTKGAIYNFTVGLAQSSPRSASAPTLSPLARSGRR